MEFTQDEKKLLLDILSDYIYINELEPDSMECYLLEKMNEEWWLKN